MHKLVIFFTDGQSREDGSVFYSKYGLVRPKPEKKDNVFGEPFFDVNTTHVYSSEEAAVHLDKIGYTVEWLDAPTFIQWDDEPEHEDSCRCETCRAWGN